MPQERPCKSSLGHEPPRPEECRICWNAVNKREYAALYGMPLPPKSQPLSRPPRLKPSMSVEEIAARRKRCQQLSAHGLPCHEFDTPKTVNEWAVGVTTVGITSFDQTLAVTREGDLLPRTLKSLENAGFPKPRLFVDGISNSDAARWEQKFCVEISGRGVPGVGTRGHWLLSLLELVMKNPNADRYAMFQDDIICMANLRAYLDANPFPQDGYANLITIYENEKVIKNREGGWVEASYLTSGKHFHGRAPQSGRGACGLVFTKQSVRGLFREPHLLNSINSGDWKKRVDGGIVETMNRAGFREYVHAPSLIQHVGHKSTMGSKKHPSAATFLGESHDALTLLAVNAKDAVGKG